MRIDQKLVLQRKRRWRIRKKVRGTETRPRMSVRFTNKNIHVQFIDDEAGVTLASATSLSKSLKGAGAIGSNANGAKRLGEAAAEAAKARGITQVVFDRSGARYHGKVKALAEAARAGGLNF